MLSEEVELLETDSSRRHVCGLLTGVGSATHTSSSPTPTPTLATTTATTTTTTTASSSPSSSAPHTTSVSRAFTDLSLHEFCGYSFTLCALRTMLQQPINLALARKQTCHVSSSMSTFSLLRRIFREEGRWGALRQGMAAMTLGCALSEVLYVLLFEYGREFLPLHSAVARDGAAGYLADASCRIIHIPLSIVAYRQMTSSAGCHTRHAPRRNALHTLRAMYHERGMRTIFAGYGTTLLVGCQWSALWWATYGVLKEWMYTAAGPLLRRAEERAHQSTSSSTVEIVGVLGHVARWASCAGLLNVEDNLLLNSSASIITSASTAVLFNPYLVVRTNLQVIPHARLLDVTRTLYRTRGVRGFYSGLWLNISACVVDGALASTSYEYAKLWADTSRRTS